MLRKTTVVILSVILCLGLLPSAAFAANEGTYTGAVLAAVNINTSAQRSEGHFATSSAAARMRARVLAADGDECYDCGLPELPELLTPPEPVMVPNNDPGSGAYAVGSVKTITDYYRFAADPSAAAVTMRCLYVGARCTVWGSTSDPEATRLPAETAERYGRGFDSNFERMNEVFGSWCDADGDGRVAILCYDLQNNYEKNTGASVSGYFFFPNLLDSGKNVAGHHIGYSDSIAPLFFGMDCVHVDTAGGPDSVDRFDDEATILDRISTIEHEYQHLINASWGLKETGLPNDMESVMNEGMSRAAQMLCDESFADSQTSYFNQSYSPGTGLYDWDGSYAHYCNAFLLVEYMRTRYAQAVDPDDGGNGVFRAIQEQRVNDQPTSDTVALAASRIFGTTEVELTKDLWAAVLLKEPTGIHGFNGEAWAAKLMPRIYDSPAADANGIYNGGVRYYRLDSGSCTVTQATDLDFLTFEDAVADSGTCGDGLTWEYSLSGTLSIEGSGPMANYDFNSDYPPWYDCRSSIRRLTVSEGVTAIGARAFMYDRYLKSAVLPDSLTSIGFAAFFDCRSLCEITISEGVTLLGSQSFAGCNSLTDVFFLGDGPAVYAAGHAPSFDSGVTLHYLQGRGGWTDSPAYDAEAGTWSGYKTACWGATDGSILLTEENGVYSAVGTVPETGDGSVVYLAVYGADQRLERLVAQSRGAGERNVGLFAEAGAEDTAVKLFVLNAADWTPVKGALIWSQ